MKDRKIIAAFLTAAVFLAGSVFTAFAADPEGLSPVRIWGNIEQKTEKSLELENKNPNVYNGSVILHLKDDTKILDAVSGMPLTLDQINTGDFVYAYMEQVMTLSIPPQAGSNLILANIPEDYRVPYYVQVKEMEASNGGYVMTATDGITFQIPSGCPVSPYLTRNMLYLEDIYEGAQCLIWTDENEKAEKIMVFPPYGAEPGNTGEKSADGKAQNKTFGWKLEGGEAGTASAVWVYYKEDGTMEKGWLKDSGKWYYLNPQTGIMERGFLQIDGKTYYLQQDGSMLTESKIFVPDADGALRENLT